MPRAIFACQSRPDPGVFESQVLATGDLFARLGITFDYHLFEGLKTWLTDRRQLAARVDSLASAWQSTIHLHYGPAPISPGGITRAGSVLARAARALSTRSLLIKARGAAAACSAIEARRRLPGIRVLYDARADAAAEARLVAAAAGTPGRGRWLARADRLAELETEASRSCDFALAVSEPLKQHVCELGGRDAGSVAVVPCCVAADRFAVDAGVRARLRRELGFDHNTVYVYSGSLGTYQVPEELARLIDALAHADQDSRFLVLTADATDGARHFSALVARGVCLLRRASFAEVRDYLAAADVALLLRRRDPVNRVACPVKFAEYWCAGLPVVVTPEIGDVSDLVRTTGFGVVIDLDRDPETNAGSVLAAHLAAVPRDLVRQLGLERFDRASHLETYRQVLRELGVGGGDGELPGGSRP